MLDVMYDDVGFCDGKVEYRFYRFCVKVWSVIKYGRIVGLVNEVFWELMLS